jgi:hypothetical protein
LALNLPPFNQYQSPIVPLRGLWNAAPVEGDKFVTAEIDWLVTTTQQAVQFSISANSPVAFSQIVCMAVDNSRSGADVDFIFSDSGFILTVPAHNQVVAPVFTNALMFYVAAHAAVLGDITTFQVLNSMPATIQIAPSTDQNHAAATGVSIVNGTTPIVAAPITGTLNTLSITLDATAGIAQIALIDGTGRIVWVSSPAVVAAGPINYNLSGLSVRFTAGLFIQIIGSTMTGASLVANVYFSTP